METHTTDQEQLEAIKRWWAENGRSIIIGLVLGVGAVGGFRYWLSYSEQRSVAAAELYASMQAATQQGEVEKALDDGALLIADYARTPYAALAALRMARMRVDAGNLEAAQNHLEVAMDLASDEGTRHVARLRLARVMLARGEVDAALTVIADVEPGSFTPEYEELKGDIFVAQNQMDAARQAYQLASLSASQARREPLQLKLENLPPATATSSSSDAIDDTSAMDTGSAVKTGDSETTGEK